DQVDPARAAALVAQNAMADQETSVRGFALAGDQQFLSPYTAGERDSALALARLDAIAADAGDATLQAEISDARSGIAAWRTRYARPAIQRINAAGPGRLASEDVTEGKVLFDAVRRSFDRLNAHLSAQRADARSDLSGAASTLTLSLVFATVVLLGAL